MFFGSPLGYKLVDYQPDHVSGCCALLRDKAKDHVALKVGGMEWELQRV